MVCIDLYGSMISPFTSPLMRIAWGLICVQYGSCCLSHEVLGNLGLFYSNFSNYKDYIFEEKLSQRR